MKILNILSFIYLPGFPHVHGTIAPRGVLVRVRVPGGAGRGPAAAPARCCTRGGGAAPVRGACGFRHVWRH